MSLTCTFDGTAPEYEWRFEINEVVRYSASGKAYLISSELFDEPVWFPLSQTQIDDDGNGPVFLLVTNWMMEQKFADGSLDRDVFYAAVKDFNQANQLPSTTREDAPTSCHKLQLKCPSCGAVHPYDEFQEPMVKSTPGRSLDDGTTKATRPSDWTPTYGEDVPF